MAAALMKKRKKSRDTLVPLWAGLLFLGSPVLFCESAAGTTDLQVSVEGGLVSVIADNVPVEFVVRDIADKADLRLVQHGAVDRDVTISIDQQSLPDVLHEILGNDSYQLYQAVSGEDDSGSGHAVPGVLWIFSRGSAFAPAATAFLETVVLQGDYAEKKEAIRELRRLATPNAVQTLSVALGDDDPRVRDAAMEALSSIGGEEAQSAIASALMADEARARASAAQAMAMTGGNSAVDYLSTTLDDEDARVRISIIESLADLGDDKSLHIIRQALRDPDSEVRERAVEVLDELEGDAMFRAVFPPE